MGSLLVRTLSYVSKVLLICLALSQPRAVLHANVFTSKTELFHLTFHRENIYVGAKNFIYKLDINLTGVHKNKTTGPVLDNRNCYGSLSDCTVKNSTDNFNKILLVNDRTNSPFLITCGSVFQGVCQFRDLNTLSVNHHITTQLVSTNEKNASTVAFIAKGPKGDSGNDRDFLYVGATLNNRPEILYDNKLLAVSSRIIDTSYSRNILKSPKSPLLHLQVKYDSKYIVDYIHGFSFGGFSYFVTVQPTRIGTTEHHSKIIRICQSTSYNTYTEIPLECNDLAGNKYNLLVGASFVKLSGESATLMKTDENEGLLIGVFGKSRGPGKIQSGNYAVCSFLMKNVNRKIDENINQCIVKGIPSDGGIPWSKQFKSCKEGKEFFDLRKNSKIYSANSVISCKDVIYMRDFPQGGTIPAVSISNLTFYAASLSSITALTHPKGLALYMGTNDGKLLMYSVLSPTQTYKFGEEEIDTESTIKEIAVGPNQTYLYMLSKHKITKRPIRDCDKRLTCPSCLNGPYCGWCTLENKIVCSEQDAPYTMLLTESGAFLYRATTSWRERRILFSLTNTSPSPCSLKAECKFANEPLHFVSDSTSKCPKIVSVSPDPTALSVWYQKEVIMNIVNLPVLSNGKSYVCDFGGKTVGATVRGDEYFCKAPPLKDLPGFTADKVSLDINLKLKTSHIAEDVMEAKVTFYNCRAFSSCLKCTRYKYHCDWCSKNLTCVDNGANECGSSGGIIRYGGPTQVVLVSECPRLSHVDTKFVAHNADRGITVSGSNFPDEATQHKYQCEVSYGSSSFKTHGKKISSKVITCDSTKYTYPDDKQDVTAMVQIKFGGKLLDSVNQLKVTLYKCGYNRDDCSICLDSPKAWDCGWCEARGKCTIFDFCSKNSDTWRNNTCPAPTITEFSPANGTISGGTKVIMKGRDLGTQFSDVMNVTVAGQNCTLIRKEYVPSKQVVCNTSATTGEKDGKVVIYVRFTAEKVKVVRGVSNKEFHYRQPRVGRFKPTQSPCSGGTRINVYGSNLNVGSSIQVKAGGRECSLTTITEKRLECKLISSCSKRARRQVRSDTVVVVFDGNPLPSASNERFEFKADPVVTNAYTNRRTMPLETFKSGGQEFFAVGERLTLLQKPQMKFIVYNKKPFAKDCKIITDTKMTCISPNISAVVGRINRTEVGLGFIVNNVQRLYVLENITVRQDPEFKAFIGVRTLKTTDLILEGTNLDLLSKEDVNVTVGGIPCKVTSVGEMLVCTAPGEKTVKAALGDKHAIVVPIRWQLRGQKVVKDVYRPNSSTYFHKLAFKLSLVYIGKGGPKYVLGSLKYEQKEKTPLLLYIGIAAGGGFILLVVIIILIILYRRRNKKEKHYHKIHQMQMDNIEARYARECKEAFAELQTEITDLTTDLGSSVVPYLNFESYAMRVLFPGIDIHPVMEKDCNKSDSWKRCMSSLCDLMKNKDFLLVFIKTLEGQPSFVMRDRCKFASLLMVTLQEDIKYVTDVLQELLSDLIERSVEAGRAKLLLRRTESVAEKLLTNWLAYALHQYLEGRVGEPLFRLFSAIGALLDKEPVDAITCEARNSLSEDRLLRQKVDFQLKGLRAQNVNQDASLKKLSVFNKNLSSSVIPNKQYQTIQAQVEYEEGNVQVSLLNCDTISQAKEKILNLIYKNSAYSQRPNKDTLVLAYVTPNGGEKILHEEDSTSEFEGTDWKRLNTLEHYLIPDGCQLKLLPFTMYSDGTGTPGKGDVFHDSSVPSVVFVPNHSSTPMLNSHHHHHDQPRLWHLVKATDYPTDQKEDARQSKMMAEVYLARLLKTKGTLQNFVDDLFNAIFIIPKQTTKASPIPPAMKFLFDFLDKEAGLLGVNDSETLHTWKNNSLPLRFWINIIKNPNFVFDVYKSNTVDSCLSVIAQLFMDSCSPDEHRLGKDSPSNKLLYAKEIPEYKKMVARFYSEVKSLPPVTDREMNDALSEISKQFGDTFNRYNAASEVMSYAVKYKVKVMDALEDAELQHFAEQLQEIMESQPDE